MSTSYILGVEIGGTKQQIALASPEGEILKILQGRVAPEEGAEGIKNWLLTEIPPFTRQAQQDEKAVERIGIGFGGPVDSHTGSILKSVQVRGWSGFPLKSWFEKNFNLPTLVANDTNAAAWGEYCRGSGRGTEQFFYTNMGSGVGGGLILDGKLYDGQGYGAGEFGQTYVPDWTSSEPGKAGKIEKPRCIYSW
jgi:glucokinase